MSKKDPYDIRKIFDDMTLSLFLSLRRNMSRHKLDETEEGFRWEQWQAAKLRNIQEYRKANRLLIRNANKEADKLIDTVVKDSFMDGAQRSLSRWDRFLNVILKPFGLERVPLGSELAIPKDVKPLIKPDPVVWDDLPEPMPEQDFFKLNEKKIKALQDAAKKDIHKANQNTMRKMDDVYRQVIFEAEMNMAAGAKTLNQAIDMATKNFLERGIDSITYSDGRKMNIASYAEIALRTVSQRATFAGEGVKRDEWGVYTIVMSAHDNCSPWCLPFQGTVMIDDVYTSISLEDAQQLSRQTGYTRLSVAMAEGAFHPACRHTLATFFPGISQLPVVPDRKKALKNYEAEQRQRYMERTIRKYKRLEAGSLDDMNRVKYGRKVKEWDKRLKQHLAKHPELKRDRIRERIDGEVTSIQRNENLKIADNRAKIGETQRHIQSEKQPKSILKGQQNKHIPGTHEYNQYVDKLKAAGQYGPSHLTIDQNEITELIKQYAGKGEITFNKKGEWDRKETIITNDKVIGVAVDNRTGNEAETTVFKIHYGNKGVHIVPDYPSKKRRRD